MSCEDVRNAFEVGLCTVDDGLGHPCAGRWSRERSCPVHVNVKRIRVSAMVGEVSQSSTERCSSRARHNLPCFASLDVGSRVVLFERQHLHAIHGITIAGTMIAPPRHRRVVLSDSRASKLRRHGGRVCRRRPLSSGARTAKTTFIVRTQRSRSQPQVMVRVRVRVGLLRHSYLVRVRVRVRI